MGAGAIMAGPWEKFSAPETKAKVTPEVKPAKKPWEQFAEGTAERPKNDSALLKVLNLVDYPFRVARTGIAQLGAEPGKFSVGEALASPLSAPKETATGVDILNAYPKIKSALIGKSREDALKDIEKIPDPQLREFTKQKLMQADKPDFKTIENVAGFATELGVSVPVSKALSAAGQGIAGLIRKGAAPAEEIARARAVKGLGRMTPTAEQALGTSGKSALGKELLDQGIIRKIPASKKTLLERVTKGLQEQGKKIGAIVDKLGDTEDALRAQGFQTGVDKKSIIKTVLSDPNLPHIDPQFQRVRDGILKNFASVAGEGANLSIRDAQAFKTRLGNIINWKAIKLGDISDRDRVLVRIYDSLNNGVLDAAEGLSKTLPNQKLIGEGAAQGASLAKEIKQARSLYEKFKTAEKILDSEIAKSGVQRSISLTDYLTGGLGAATMGPEGAALGLANLLGRKFGSQALATGARGVSKALPGVAEAIESISGRPYVAPALAQLLKLNQERAK